MLVRPAKFIEPCLPPPAEHPPAGGGWLHEIKHDGYRLMARRDAAGVRLLTRNGHDWTPRFALIRPPMDALLKMPRCYLVAGIAVECM